MEFYDLLRKNAFGYLFDFTRKNQRAKNGILPKTCYKPDTILYAFKYINVFIS
jgi:hypothetical protein